jgi:hypothetical protein
MRKILISPGFGAGWSTWIGATREQKEFALFDAKLIEAVERGLTQADVDDFEARFEAAFPGESCYTGGARDLCVREVEGEFLVEEYDGSESLRFRDSGEWF